MPQMTEMSYFSIVADRAEWIGLNNIQWVVQKYMWVSWNESITLEVV